MATEEDVGESLTPFPQGLKPNESQELNVGPFEAQGKPKAPTPKPKNTVRSDCATKRILLAFVIAYRTGTFAELLPA